LIEKTNILKLEKKPVNQIHGEKVLYQIIWGNTRGNKTFLKRITAVAQMSIPPGETNLVHNHKDDEQIYLILKGGGTVQIGDERTETEEGDVIFLPVNVPHAFFNTTADETVILNVSCRVT